MAGTAQDAVSASTAIECIIADIAIQCIGQGATGQHVSECIAGDRESLTRSIACRILNAYAAQANGGTPQQDQIRPLPACLREQVTIADNKNIIAIAAPHNVSACAAIQRIVTTPTVQPVITRTARKTIGDAITKQAVMACTGNDVFDTDQPVNAMRPFSRAGDKINCDRSCG